MDVQTEDAAQQSKAPEKEPAANLPGQEQANAAVGESSSVDVAPVEGVRPSQDAEEARSGGSEELAGEVTAATEEVAQPKAEGGGGEAHVAADDAAAAGEPKAQAAPLSDDVAQLRKDLEEARVSLKECAKLHDALRQSQDAVEKERKDHAAADAAAKSAEQKVASLTEEVEQLRKDLSEGLGALRQRAEQAEALAAERSDECSRLADLLRQSQEAHVNTGNGTQAHVTPGVPAEAQLQRLATDPRSLVGRQVAFHSRLHNRFVSVRSDGYMGASARMDVDSPPSAWERYTVVDAGGGAISFFNAAGRCFMVMWGELVGSWSKENLEKREEWSPIRCFTMVAVGRGEVGLHSKGWNRLIRMRRVDALDASEPAAKDKPVSARAEERFTLVVL